jgi:uncharacterized protein YndB with AHSA1/START domain
MITTTDRIEHEIRIDAAITRVWEVLTTGEHVGVWFGIGEPASIDLRPGGELVIVHNRSAHGRLLGRVEAVQEPRYFAYRWSHDPAGQPPDAHNSTMVEFHLSAEGHGTRLHLVESGFAALAGPEQFRRQRHDQNSLGWQDRILPALQRYAEHSQP